MAYTLLEMVQRVLAAMDSDEVNSISDTTESNQVALLIEGVYNDLLAECSLPAVDNLIELTASGDNTKPVLMTLPATVMKLYWMKYNQQEDADTVEDWQPVTFMDIKDFMEYTNTFRDDSSAASFDHVIGTDTVSFTYLNDVHPTYFTSFDDGTLIFDSYDSSVDTTLQKSKTQCFAATIPAFTQSDSFTPDLDPAEFSLLMNEAKARAFVELKQASNTNAEGHARRLRIRMRNAKRKLPYESRYPLSVLPNYGRK